MASSGSDAVRHIVMMKLADKRDKAQVVETLRQLEKGVTGVKFLAINIVTDLGLVETNSDVAVIIDFPDKENYLMYATHPEHQNVVAANKPYIAGRSALQFSLGSRL